MRKPITDVAVIGGGASGMLVSILCARRGLRTELIEKNEYTGKKLRITGKGRCNLTNNCTIREIFDNIPTNGKFLYSAVNAFTPQDVMSFFESLGVPLKTERGNRVFPVSDRAEDVVSALRAEMRKCGVKFIRSTAVSIKTDDGRVVSIITTDGEIECMSAVLCTGGISYPLTGSTGDGYRISHELGHAIIPPRPSLVPLEIKQSFCRDLQGLSLRNVTLSAYDKAGKLLSTELGEMLFTHFGISGPLVLSASAHMRDYEGIGYYVTVDLKPGLDEQKLDARILRDFEKYANRDFANSLDDLVNKRMVPILVSLSEIPPDTKVNSITREQRHRLAGLLKSLRLDITSPRPIDEAVITSGGVDTREINPKTMESKIIKGLYFAGEIIDVDAYTGGFNLQIAWSTAYAAASHIEVEL